MLTGGSPTVNGGKCDLPTVGAPYGVVVVSAGLRTGGESPIGMGDQVIDPQVGYVGALGISAIGNPAAVGREARFPEPPACGEYF